VMMQPMMNGCERKFMTHVTVLPSIPITNHIHNYHHDFVPNVSHPQPPTPLVRRSSFHFWYTIPNTKCSHHLPSPIPINHYYPNYIQRKCVWCMGGLLLLQQYLKKKRRYNGSSLIVQLFDENAILIHKR